MRHKSNAEEAGLVLNQEHKPGKELNHGRTRSVTVRILMMLYVFMGSFGCLLAVTSSARIVCFKAALLLWLLIASVCMVLLFDGRRLRLQKLVVSAGIYGGILLLGRTIVSKSVPGILEAVLYYLNPYYGWNLQAGGEAAEVTRLSNTAGLLILFVPVVILLAYGITSAVYYQVCIVVLAVGLFAPFLYGEVPDGWSVLFLVTASAGIFAMKQAVVYVKAESAFAFLEVQKKVGLLIPGIAALTVIIGMIFSQMVLAPVFSDRRLIKAKFEYAVEKYASISFDHSKAQGGVSNGNLGAAEELVTDNKVQLKVVADSLPERTLYLQGYIGSRYENNQWVESPRKALQKWNDGALKEYSGVELHNLAYEFIAQKEGRLIGERQHTLEVEVVDSNPKYRYVPYGSYYPEEEEVRGDTYVYGQGEPVYSVSYYPMDGAVYRDYEHIIEEMQTILQAQGEYNPEILTKSKAEELYEAYVRETYLQVPEHVKESFAEVMRQFTAWNRFHSAQQIAVMLARQTEYSLKPGRTPFGEDFAEYFYFQNRRGYCAHYATVAALMLRMKEIPARFVSGYAVNPNDFTQLEDGSYEALVTGDNAHAWAEIYYPRLGWLPVETTPGYYGSARAAGNGTVLEDEPENETMDVNQEPEQPEQKEQAEQQEELAQENQAQTESDKEQEQDRENGFGFSGLFGTGNVRLKAATKAIFLVAAALFLSAALVLLRRRMIMRMRFQKGGKNWNERIRYLFRELYEVFVFAGVPKHADCLSGSFVELVCDADVGIAAADVERMMNLVLQANYGKEKLTKADYLFVKNLYRMTVQHVTARLSGREKIILRYIKCF